MSNPSNDTVAAFARLFNGRKDAVGSAQGGVSRVKPGRPPISEAGWFKLYQRHLQGIQGIGVFPMLDGDVVNFAAIDLDEPDFEAAREMQGFLPGSTWIERSRSGNAHVWVFFAEPVEAWVPRGILRTATEAVGKRKVEVFPKQDRLLEGMVGNYINLPYYGDTRPIIAVLTGGRVHHEFTVHEFIGYANDELNDPADWRKRARWLDIKPPEERQGDGPDFGSAPTLHICAEHIIANRADTPVTQGHRNVVYFNLAKMLLNYEGFDRDEALYYMRLVNEDSPDQIEDWELRKLIENAERGRYTSTGCDDPLMSPYVHPDCPIAYPDKRKP